MKKILVFTSLFLLVAMPAIAQKKYEQKIAQDGVTIMAKWKPSKCMKKNSTPKLRLKLQNANDYPVSVNFTLTFFDTGIAKEHSQVFEGCIKSGKTRTGRKHGLTWLAEGHTADDVKAEAFAWEVDKLSIAKTDACPKKP